MRKKYDSNNWSVNKFVLLLSCLLLLFCVISRFVFVAKSDVGLIYDAKRLTLLANNILNGNGFVYDAGIPRASRAPLYPLFLAGIGKLFGPDHQLVRYVEALINSLLLIVIYQIGKTLCSRSVGLISAIIYGLSSITYFSTVTILTENLTTFLFFTGFMVIFKNDLINSRSKLLFVLGWILIMLSCLVRPNNVVFIPFYVLYLIFRERRIWVKKAVYVICIGLLVLSPWTMRNYKIYNKIIPITSSGPGNIFIGNYFDVGGRRYDIEKKGLPAPLVSEISGYLKYDSDEELYEPYVSDFYWKHIKTKLTSHPVDSLMYIAKKMSLAFLPYDDWYDWYKKLGIDERHFEYFFPLKMLSYKILFLPFVTGIVLALRAKYNALLLLYLASQIFLIGLVFYDGPRYRIIFYPVVAIYAGILVDFILRKINLIRRTKEVV